MPEGRMDFSNPFTILYLGISVSLLLAGARFWTYWMKVAREFRPGEQGHEMASLIDGLFLRLTLSQVLVVVLAAVLYVDDVTVPRGLIGMLIQGVYLVTFLWGVMRVRRIIRS